MTTIGIIPARYQSSRFPGKPLIDILGKSMIQRVYEQAKESSVDRLIVATDDLRIKQEVKTFGGEVIMTSNKHISGTDRCLEVIEKIDENYDVVVNVQGDEPFIHPSQINQLIDAFDNASTQIATLAKIIKNKSVILDQHTTKVKFDDDFWATSFDRLLPVKKETSYYKHIGLYAYRTEILKEISKLAATEKECQLRLEQWRWLDHCYSIKIQLTSHDAFSIDTPEDLKKVIQRFG